MNAKDVILAICHLVLILLIILLLVGSGRYISSFYSSIDTLGDKKIPVLIFLVILGLVTSIGSLALATKGAGKIFGHWSIRTFEVGVSILTLLINIIVTFTNLKKI